MAHARIDYHMDFISLLSLSNIGVVEPEVFMLKKQQATTLGADHHGQEVHRLNGTIAHPQPPSQNMNGLSLHLMNGLERGLKRGRENGEDLEQEQLYTKRNCLQKSSLPEGRANPHPHLGVPQAHLELPHHPESSQDNTVEQEMEQEIHCQHSNGFVEQHSSYNGMKVNRRVQFCTGLIEEVMSSADLSETSLASFTMKQCSKCQSGQPGHLDHLFQASKSSSMDTS